MASVLAGIMAVPAGMYFASLTEAPLAVIGAAVVFLPLFILSKVIRLETGEDRQAFDLLPKLMREAREVDAGAVIEAFGKNEQMKKVFWTLFLALAGIVLARIADPATAQKVLGILTGAG